MVVETFRAFSRVAVFFLLIKICAKSMKPWCRPQCKNTMDFFAFPKYTGIFCLNHAPSFHVFSRKSLRILHTSFFRPRFDVFLGGNFVYVQNISLYTQRAQKTFCYILQYNQDQKYFQLYFPEATTFTFSYRF